jgi:hypothetical protein
MDTKNFISTKTIFIISLILSVVSIYVSFVNGWILAYGDAESHINIAKKVVDALTPGFAQLGGIWLPLPHILMLPFVWPDFLWRTGLAGSIVSGSAFVISSIYLYKTVLFLTKDKWASFFGFLAFSLNPNILYMQTTPMTELPLIAFFIISTYYFIKYLYIKSGLPYLILSSFFAFCATLTRYDGWFLVGFEGLVLLFLAVFERAKHKRFFGEFIIFSVVGGFGIFIWLFWGWLILGDPLYFMHSQYSAHAQQLAWLAKQELPSYKNIVSSAVYYSVTTVSNLGIVISVVSLLGLLYFFIDKNINKRFFIILILLVPFIFNVVSLFMGQDVIFIPYLTPKNFEWNLFNVRYGMLMISVGALFFGFLFSKLNSVFKSILVFLLMLQTILYISGISPTITLLDGTKGLSAAKTPQDVENYINKNYTGGLVLIDDYARTISITKSTIPMQNVIYVGTKPYWGDSLKTPEKYATWIIMQKNDAVWNSIYENPQKRGELYKYFNKVYGTNQILVFRKMR